MASTNCTPCDRPGAAQSPGTTYVEVCCVFKASFAGLACLRRRREQLRPGMASTVN
jgi:hypothetical protein